MELGVNVILSTITTDGYFCRSDVVSHTNLRVESELNVYNFKQVYVLRSIDYGQYRNYFAMSSFQGHERRAIVEGYLPSTS